MMKKREIIHEPGFHIGERIIDETGTSIFHHRSEIVGDVEVLMYSAASGRPLLTSTLTTKNTLLVTGEVFFTEKMNAQRVNWRPPAIDEALGVNESQIVEIYVNDVSYIGKEKVCGFMIGTGGSGDTYGDVNPVHRTDLMVPNPIPFRMVPIDSDLDSETRKKYFLRVIKGNYVCYYGKKFTSDRDTIVQYEDGTPVPQNVYTIGDENGKHIKSSTAFQMDIDTDEIREYFKITDGGTARCRFNSVGLVGGCVDTKADEIIPEGYEEYFNVRGITTANLYNRALKHPSDTSRLRYLVNFM